MKEYLYNPPSGWLSNPALIGHHCPQCHAALTTPTSNSIGNMDEGMVTLRRARRDVCLCMCVCACACMCVYACVCHCGAVGKTMGSQLQGSEFKSPTCPSWFQNWCSHPLSLPPCGVHPTPSHQCKWGPGIFWGANYLAIFHIPALVQVGLRVPTPLSGRDGQSSCELLALLQEFASIGSECLLNAQAAWLTAQRQQYNLHFAFACVCMHVCVCMRVCVCVCVLYLRRFIVHHQEIILSSMFDKGVSI